MQFVRGDAGLKGDGSMFHTPVPWSHEPADSPMPAALLGADGSTIAEAVYELEDDGPRREMDFALIARAVNAHNELLAALDSFVAWAAGFAKNHRDPVIRHDGLRCIDEGLAAIAKARGVAPK